MMIVPKDRRYTINCVSKSYEIKIALYDVDNDFTEPKMSREYGFLFKCPEKLRRQRGS